MNPWNFDDDKELIADKADYGCDSFVQEQINRSTIPRVPWKKLLGLSLTRHILKLKKKDWSPNDIIEIVKMNPKVLQYIRLNNNIDVLKNLKISVCARFSASKTAEEVEDAN